MKGSPCEHQDGMSRRDIVKSTTAIAAVTASAGFLTKAEPAMAANGPAWEQVSSQYWIGG